MRASIFFGVFGLFALVSSTGCSSTSITNTRVAPEASKFTPIDSVIVVGIDPAIEIRKLFEDEFAERLEAAGVRAVPSHTLLRDDQRADKENLASHVERLGIDAILSSSLIGIEEETRYVTAPLRYPYWNPRRDIYWSYYPWAYDRVYTRGYFETYKNYELQTRLYEAQNGTVLWSATSETLAPRSVNRLAESVAEQLVENLNKHGLLEVRERAQ